MEMESARLLEVLARVEGRLERIERTLAPIQEVAEVFPAGVAMAADALDERASDLALNDRLQRALELSERVSRPQVLGLMTQLVELAESGPAAAAMMGDIVDHWAAEKGDFDQRLRQGVALLDRLTTPATLKGLNALLDLVDAAPGALAMVGDILDEKAAKAQEMGLDLSAVAESLPALLDSVLRLAASPHLPDLLEPAAVERAAHILEASVKALETAGTQEPPRLGLFAAFGAMRDPAVQQALGFALTMAREFSKALDGESERPNTKGK
jgi:hypothetical protein